VVLLIGFLELLFKFLNEDFLLATRCFRALLLIISLSLLAAQKLRAVLFSLLKLQLQRKLLLLMRGGEFLKLGVKALNLLLLFLALKLVLAGQFLLVMQRLLVVVQLLA